MQQFDKIEDGASRDGEVSINKNNMCEGNIGKSLAAGHALSFLNVLLSCAVLILVATASPLLASEEPAVEYSTEANCSEVSGPRVSKNIKDLTPEERLVVVAAFKAMKEAPSQYSLNTTFDADALAANGDPANAWDYFTAVHWEATTPGSEVHANWQFFPWHREFLRRTMDEMRRVTGDDTLILPYVDFEDPDSFAAMMDMQNFIGGYGNPGNNYYVEYGHFTMDQWPTWNNPFSESAPSLQRAVGNGFQLCLDQNNNGWYLDTLNNPPSIDDQTEVGPFIYMGIGYDLDAGPVGGSVAAMTPDAGNKDCPWLESAASPTCMRYFTGGNAGDTSFNLRCKHYASSLPAADSDLCQVYPYLPMENASRIGIFRNSNGDIVPVDRLDSSTWYNVPDTFRDGRFDYYRACIEGIDPDDEFAAILNQVGASVSGLHGITHCYVGGQAASNQSPNDPIFMMIHMNVDRLWATMQAKAGFNDWWTGPGAAHYDSPLFAFEPVTTRDIIDHEALGYTFDTLV